MGAWAGPKEVWATLSGALLETDEEGRTDGRTYRFPLYSTGLRPLRFPPGPLPCLHNSYHHKIPEQGKGTDDHLLPLGDWLSSFFVFFFRLLFSSSFFRLLFFANEN